MKKNPSPWTDAHTKAVQNIKQKSLYIPCLTLPHPNTLKIVETDASALGFGGILKQEINKKPYIIRFHSGLWNDTQSKYSTIKHEMLSIVNCILKFQDDLVNTKFLLRIDCTAAKFILEKDVQNLASKHIFARWQTLLALVDFDIEYLKGDTNSLLDFLTYEFLQGET